MQNEYLKRFVCFIFFSLVLGTLLVLQFFKIGELPNSVKSVQAKTAAITDEFWKDFDNIQKKHTVTDGFVNSEVYEQMRSEQVALAESYSKRYPVDFSYSLRYKTLLGYKFTAGIVLINVLFLLLFLILSTLSYHKYKHTEEIPVMNPLSILLSCFIVIPCIWIITSLVLISLGSGVGFGAIGIIAISAFLSFVYFSACIILYCVKGRQLIGFRSSILQASLFAVSCFVVVGVTFFLAAAR